MLLDAKLCRKENIPWQKHGDEILILNNDHQQVHELNDTAAWIWERLESTKSLQQLIGEFCDDYDVSENKAIKDIETFIQVLSDKKLLEAF